MSVNPIPEGYHTITPFLGVKDAAQFIEFVKKAFDATVLTRMPKPDGTIGHAELLIGDSRIMLTEAGERMPATNSLLHLYLPDADSAYNQAVKAGAQSIQEPADQFYGDRTAAVKDNFGITWYMATRKENLTPDQIKERAHKAMGRS